MLDPETPHPPLRAFQTWMQTFIVAPGTAQEAIQAAETHSGLAEGSAQRLVLPSSTLDEMERLMIYRRMYPLRMEEALSIDFPVSKALLGPSTFRRLVDEYVQAFPSRSWTLDHLGQHLPQFVEGHPLGEAYPGLKDLTRLEQALCEVSNAEDASVLTPECLASVEPDQWPHTRLRFVPALSLLKLDTNANDLCKAYHRDEELPPTEFGPRFLVAWRSGFQTWRLPLEPTAFRVLSLLYEGVTLGDALEQSLAGQDAEEQVFSWFGSWVGEGFFQSLLLPDPMPGPSTVPPRG